MTNEFIYLPFWVLKNFLEKEGGLDIKKDSKTSLSRNRSKFKLINELLELYLIFITTIASNESIKDDIGLNLSFKNGNKTLKFKYPSSFGLGNSSKIKNKYRIWESVETIIESFFNETNIENLIYKNQIYINRTFPNLDKKIDFSQWKPCLLMSQDLFFKAHKRSIMGKDLPKFPIYYSDQYDFLGNKIWVVNQFEPSFNVFCSLIPSNPDLWRGIAKYLYNPSVFDDLEEQFVSFIDKKFMATKTMYWGCLYSTLWPVFCIEIL